jgi:beta-glucuronidase
MGHPAGWFSGALARAGEWAVPASFTTSPPARARARNGDVWYQTTVRVPRAWDGRRIDLHFESATQRATVWVNDALVVSHEGW